MDTIIKRISLILIITHACTIVGMEGHNWWQNGKDADPTPPTRDELIHYLVVPRVARLPPDVATQVWNSIADGVKNSSAFSVENAAAILYRYEDEQERIEDEQERRFWFFHPVASNDVSDDEKS